MGTIDSINIYHYRLPLLYSINWNNRINHHREGLLICLTSGEYEGWGEISPLVGFSQESLQEAMDQAINLSKRFLQSSSKSADFSDTELFPSVQFGFELAQYHLKLPHQSTNLQPSIACCMLFTPEILHHVSLLDKPLRNGFKAVKIKVGRRTIEEDIELVHRVCETNHGVEIRLDANRSWTLKEFFFFLDGVENLSLSYIEEPLKYKIDLKQVANHSRIPIALDETLREIDAENFKQYADVYILKPALSGGFNHTLKEIYDARTNGIRCVISSSYESGVGMTGLLELANNIPDEIHGLDTYRIFKEDVFKSTLPLIGPSIELPRQTIRKTDLNFSILEKVWGMPDNEPSQLL